MASGIDNYDQQLADFMRFTGNKPTKGKTAFILVMGMTGAGKSTLIQQCTGKDVPVGHGLRSCTNNLSVHSFRHDGYHVHMIDTPGFDDTNRSDIETLKTITSYLSASFVNGVRINGIIYLHRISDNRLSGTGLRNLRMFKKLSGSSAWPNTALGTTMWSTGDYTENEARERELGSDMDYFGELLSRGAEQFRVRGGGEQKISGLQMVSHLLQRMRVTQSLELQVQCELVHKKKHLDATAAGQEALGIIFHLRTQMTRQLKAAQRDMKEALRARDIESARQLEAVKNDITRKLQQSEKQQEELKASLGEMHEEEVDKLVSRLDEMEGQHRKALKSKQEELRDLEESLKLMREQSARDEARWKQQAREAEVLERQRKLLDAAMLERKLQALDTAVLERERRSLDVAMREKKRQALDVAALERKRRMNEEADQECEREVVVLRQEMVQQEKQLGSIAQAKTAVRGNVVNGISNGLAAGATTAIATLALGAMCVVS